MYEFISLKKSHIFVLYGSKQSHTVLLIESLFYLNRKYLNLIFKESLLLKLNFMINIKICNLVQIVLHSKFDSQTLF